MQDKSCPCRASLTMQDNVLRLSYCIHDLVPYMDQVVQDMSMKSPMLAMMLPQKQVNAGQQLPVHGTIGDTR